MDLEDIINRRTFLKETFLAGAGLALVAACGPNEMAAERLDENSVMPPVTEKYIGKEWSVYRDGEWKPVYQEMREVLGEEFNIDATGFTEKYKPLQVTANFAFYLHGQDKRNFLPGDYYGLLSEDGLVGFLFDKRAGLIGVVKQVGRDEFESDRLKKEGDLWMIEHREYFFKNQGIRKDKEPAYHELNVPFDPAPYRE